LASRYKEDCTSEEARGVFFFFGGTQDFVLAKQMLYCLSHAPSLGCLTKGKIRIL
jgi:hypothetical protein